MGRVTSGAGLEQPSRSGLFQTCCALRPPPKAQPQHFLPTPVPSCLTLPSRPRPLHDVSASVTKGQATLSSSGVVMSTNPTDKCLLPGLVTRTSQHFEKNLDVFLSQRRDLCFRQTGGTVGCGPVPNFPVTILCAHWAPTEGVCYPRPVLSLIHISEPTRPITTSRMPSSA